jgi:cytochrome c-type biogenesis protein CcmE
MTRKQRRSLFLGVGFLVLAGAAALVLNAFQDSIVFFYSPAEVAEKHIAPGQRFRIGGLVEMGSVKRGPGDRAEFVVTDMNKTIKVIHDGVLPDLFREGQGVVAEGHLDAQNVFIAEKVLAKHDEKYIPREVVDALKKQGKWREGGQPGGVLLSKEQK